MFFRIRRPGIKKRIYAIVVRDILLNLPHDSFVSETSQKHISL